METPNKEIEEKPSTKITFTNQPILSEHEVDAKFNERRNYLTKEVADFLSTDPRFKGKEITVTFAVKGISSLVCILETVDGKFVLKIPLSLSYSNGEAEFLEAWEKAGVDVPHIFESGRMGAHSYTLMEYVDAPTLSAKYTHEEMLQGRIYEEMGKILRKMHTAKGKGFGKVIDGKAEFNTFSEWINNEDFKKRIKYIKENNIIEDVEDLFEKICGILINALADQDSVYCHFDYGAHNIFATDPLTVFDPSPLFNNPYIDIGRYVKSFSSKENTEESMKQFIDGYFGGEDYDKKVMLASIILNVLYKIPYANKTKRAPTVESYKNYISNNKQLL